MFNFCLHEPTYIFLHSIQIKCSEIFVKLYDAFLFWNHSVSNHSHFRYQSFTIQAKSATQFSTLFLPRQFALGIRKLQQPVPFDNGLCGRSQVAHKKQQQHNKKKTCLTKKGERVDATFERSACCAILPRIVNHFTHFHARTSTHTQTHTGLSRSSWFIISEVALIDLIITIHPENDWPRSVQESVPRKVGSSVIVLVKRILEMLLTCFK